MSLAEQISFGSFFVSAMALAISLLSFLVSYFNFRRDTSRLCVVLNVGWKVSSGPVYDPKKEYINVQVLNIGRRPEFVNMVSVAFPDGSTGLVVDGLLNQKKVGEGDAPANFLVERDGMKAFKQQWAGAIFVVRTASGYQVRSRFLSKTPKNCEHLHYFKKLKMRAQTRFRHRWAFKNRVLLSD